MIRHACSALLLALLVVVSAGCSAEPSSEPSDAAQSGPLATYPMPNFGMDALGGGTLRLVDDCIVIEQGAYGRPMVPIFPIGDATWDGERLIWRGADYREGDYLSLGGGLRDDPAARDSASIPDGCTQFETFFLVSPL